MVKDLMPLCVDNAATEASKNVVVEHLAECKECEKYYNNIIHDISLTADCSEESKGYVAIAKRIKKRKLKIRTTIVLIIYVAFLLLINYAEGYRYTPQSAAAHSSRLNYTSRLLGNYDWGDWKFYFYNSENSYEVVTVNKHWNGWKAQDNSLVWPKYYTDNGTIINTGYLYYWTDTKNKKGIQLFPFIVEDEKVASVSVTVFNETKTMEVETNKFSILTFENGDASASNEITGYAYDAAGKLIYQLEHSEETMRFVWNKVN